MYRFAYSNLWVTMRNRGMLGGRNVDPTHMRCLHRYCLRRVRTHPHTPRPPRLLMGESKRASALLANLHLPNLTCRSGSRHRLPSPYQGSVGPRWLFAGSARRQVVVQLENASDDGRTDTNAKNGAARGGRRHGRKKGRVRPGEGRSLDESTILCH